MSYKGLRGSTLKRAELLQLLAASTVKAQAAVPDHPLRVAIDGIDAAGKSTLADELATALAALGKAIIRASVDDFQYPRARRYQRGKESPEGYYLDAFDLEAFKTQLLIPLGTGGDRHYRSAVFDYRGDSPLLVERSTAADEAILLVDGVFLLRPELRDYWDFSIFVEVTFNTCLARASQRDRELFGSAEHVQRRYLTRYIPAQKLYLEQCQPQRAADLLVLNDDPADPALRLPD
ncbi:MAG: uridine kinase [Anaerolineae bacterium]|nr:uridine kinase [Anaerolineae bacterium]